MTSSAKLKKILNKWYNANATTAEDNDIFLFYWAFYSSVHKEERIMTRIVKNNVKPTDPCRKVKLQIYYKNKKFIHLLLKNSPDTKREAMQKSYVVYRVTCKPGNCEVLPTTYIGKTTTRLSRQQTLHLSAGATKNHLQQEHNITITRKQLEDNTDIIDSCPDERRLSILEALHIKEKNPRLNIQAVDLQALPSMRRSRQPGSAAASGEDAPSEPANQRLCSPRLAAAEAGRLV
ncbi:hypothetical protein E2C01_001266 [Portunus trituberculatus]|uniref:GIY-YIG domain-containing protein n=1 Tax=Portunus trituberculatus TaxID=210409 RepID=A0A5B7CM50_PORTR|nr:hypothetical protein [Portunus trituberculatus]